MADANDTAIETRKEVEDDPAGVVNFWMTQLRLAEQADKKFTEQGREIVKRYRDERAAAATGSKFNILWSNTETLKPILYGRTPKPDVERRHKNSDPIARMGAEILERALAYEDDLDEFDKVMKRCVEDRLLPGRAVARVRYEVEEGDEEPVPDSEPDEDGKQPMFRPVKDESAPVEYVFWEDYRESPARTDEEVWWRAYRSYMTRDELVARFGREIGKEITLDYTTPDLDEAGGGEGPQGDAFKKASIWEIWDETKKEVIWIAPSYGDRPCDKKSDILKLPTFFPSPRPLRSTTTNDRLQPVADYIEYQDQAIELDVLTMRIRRLTGALRVAGVYAGSEKGTLSQLLDEGVENRLIPVEDWAGFAGDKGGLQGMIQWLPIEQIAKVLIQLYDARDRVQRTLYQITGMADILRGETDPNETLGAQQLKSQFATRRIAEAQKEVARFARDLIRLRGFVIAQHFSAETLSRMTGLPEELPELPPPPPQMIPAPPPNPMMGHNGPPGGPQMPSGGGPQPTSGAGPQLVPPQPRAAA